MIYFLLGLVILCLAYEVYMYVSNKRKVQKFDANMFNTWMANNVSQPPANYRIIEIFASHKGNPISIRISTTDPIDEAYLSKILQVISPSEETPNTNYSNKDLS